MLPEDINLWDQFMRMPAQQRSSYVPGHRLWCNLFFLCAAFLACAIAKAQQSVDGKIHIPVIVQATKLEEPADYFTTLLLMALNASKADNEVIDIVFSEREYSQARWLYLAQNEKRNFVIWTMTDKEREQQLRPIRIPLCKGLFGYRVLLIRANDQPRFDHIRNLQELSTLLAGQGTHWPDTPIMQHNGLRVTTAETTESLFRMINARRFDYFPRGISEAWFELTQRSEKNLVVEKNIMLYYPAALYFFVNKNHEALAVRIEKGLEKLIDSGEFDEFFFNHPRINFGLENLTRRHIITLENPLLPAETPVNNPRYWIDLSALSPIKRAR
ncbi:type 2 periplasmic-binding domain-containing protein [Cellvibrio mixtus]|uniref:hypothetical protein n=1 Tax=Cellvibrio mixtus TaxID=39650 RepID=UPI000694A98F|nr:hypothetical protein [Cellvibrio mixtus]